MNGFDELKPREDYLYPSSPKDLSPNVINALNKQKDRISDNNRVVLLDDLDALQTTVDAKPSVTDMKFFVEVMG